MKILIILFLQNYLQLYQMTSLPILLNICRAGKNFSLFNSLLSVYQSCSTKCTIAANHQNENIPHQCDKKCSYSKDLDNEVLKCLQCNRDGCDTTVYGKLITKSDDLVQGVIKYVWSGFFIECPYHGEIYRSRKYYYGNNETKDVTRVEVIPIWPGDGTSRLASAVTRRKFIETIVYARRFD